MTFKTAKLGAICDFEGGSQPPKSNFIFEKKEGYIRFIQIRDFNSDKNLTYIPISKKNRICKEDDILIGRYGASVGKILTGLNGAYNVALMKTIPNQAVLNKKFLYYYLSSNLFQEPLRQVSERSAQNGFSKEDIYNFSIVLPSIIEQQRIVAKLDAVFAEIDKEVEITNNLISKYKLIFENCVREHFLVKNNNTKTMKLSDVAEYFNGLTYSPKDVNPNGTIVLRSSNIQNGKMEYSDIVRVSKKIKEKLYVRPDDILICSRNGSKSLIGKSSIIGEHDEPMTFGTFMMIVRSDINHYLQWFFKSKMFKQQISKGENTAINQITRYMLDEVLLPVFEKEKQIEFSKKLTKLDTEVRRLIDLRQKKITNLNKLKSAILKQELQVRRAA